MRILLMLIGLMILLFVAWLVAPMSTREMRLLMRIVRRGKQ